MHKDAKASAGDTSPSAPTTTGRRVIGGITLYTQQLGKLAAYAKTHGISRAAAIRQLIDEHL